MDIVSAVILGVVQGLTEFLPVSSSGHLVLFQELLGFEGPRALFSVIVHLATSAAVVVFFRERLVALDRNLIALLVIGSIPAGIVGLLLEPVVDVLFTSTRLVGGALLLTSAIVYFVDAPFARRSRLSRLDAVIMGIAQAIAIVPGISRSGITILAGTGSGVDRKTVAEFSFLLSLPAVVGANVLKVSNGGLPDANALVPLASGFIAAFITGLLAIAIVMRILVERRFKVFSIYTLTMGIAALILG